MTGDEALDLIEYALRISNMNLNEVSSRPVQWRVETYNELKRSQAVYENKHMDKYSYTLKVRNIGNFQLGRLKIAGSFKIKQPQMLSDPGIERITEEFTDREYHALEKLEIFSRIDILSINQISQALFSRNGQIYTIVKRWYDEQMYEFDKLINPDEDDEGMKNYLTTAMIQSYQNRFEKIRAGIIEYIQIAPEAPRKLFQEYEQTLDKIHKAKMDRVAADQNIAETQREEYIQDLERRIGDLRSERQDLLDALHDIEFALMKSSDNSDLEKYDEKNANLATRIKNIIQELLNRIRELIEHRDILNKQIVELNNLLETSEPQIRLEIESELKILMNTINELENRINEYEEAIFQLKTDNEVLEGKLSEIKKIHEEYPETEPVEKIEALKDEHAFMELFERKMTHDLPRTFHDPIREQKINVKKATEYSHSKVDDSHYLTSMLKIEPEDLTTYPTNRRSIFKIIKTRILKANLKLVVAQIYFSHLKSHVELTKDFQPMTLTDFLTLINEERTVARSEDTYRILGIGSSTGFDERLHKYINPENSSNGFTDKYLSVCLIDPHAKRTWYNPYDVNIEPYLDLFSMELKKEKHSTILQRDIEKIIEERLKTQQIVTSIELVREGHAMEDVKNALYECEKRGLGTVYTFGSDLAIRRSS